MSLSSGHKLAHYEIVEPIGKGGMGEVYRARDGKLERDVAIKVLPDEFARDEERLARFKREAKVLASLNHPNIAAIYGLEQSGSTHYLVLELVPGETLAERISRGPIPWEEALEIAAKIAEALEEAHEQGVVHRDLKPANVMLTPDGKVKVLDFGLAKAFAGDDAAQELSQSPTISRHQTAAGVILGTAAYMSPEQARGRSVDKRSDIWSFGVVLFEMLTGKKLFDGETISDTLASILKEEPDWGLLPPETPRTLRELQRRCLQRDPRERLRDIGEARIAIAAGASAPEVSSSPAPAGSGWKTVVPWGVAALLLLVLGIVWRGEERASGKRVAHVSIDLPGEGRLWNPNAAGIAISPDGNLLAFPVGRDTAAQLYLRYLDREEAIPIPGTVGASMPFFSPDGKWLGFFQHQRLMKVAVEGGTPIELAESDRTGGSWTTDDTIIYGRNWSEGIWRISAAGGTPEQLTVRDASADELGHVYPSVLPGGKHVLVNVYRTPIERADIDVLSLETGELRVLIEGGMYGRYASSGHIVYFGKDAVMAVPFDVSRLEITGLPLPVESDVYTSIRDGFASLAFSDEGTLVYARPHTVSPDRRLVWVDRKGNVAPLTSTVRRYSNPRLSPDGQTIAVTISDAGASSIWLHEIARDAQTRLSFGEIDTAPIWAPDSRRVLYASGKDGPYQIFWRAVDGTTSEEPVLEDLVDKYPYAVSPDGVTLVYTRSQESGTGRDLWLLSLASDENPRPLLESANMELNPVISPDGQWLAYQSNESGQAEIYAQAFPSAGRRQQISTAGGSEPVWAPSGVELFYRNANQMLAVEIETEEGLRASRPRALFEKEFEFSRNNQNYDVSLDGQRFVMVQTPDSTERGQLEIVFNWFEELERLVPTN